MPGTLTDSSLRAVVFALLISTPLLVPGAEAGTNPARLSVVFDAENLPYSSHRENPPGLNVDIARLIAAQLGSELDIHWVDTQNEGLLGFLIGEDGEQPVHAAVGVPLEPRTVEDERLIGPEVLFSEPFASSRYVLVTKKDHALVNTFRAIGPKPIGVMRGSVASMRMWDTGYAVKGMPTQQSVLDAILKGDVEYGMLWNNVGWLIGQDERYRSALAISDVAPEVSGMTWNLAIAVSKEHRYLLPRLNHAIQLLRSQDAFKPVFDKYHVPFFEPIETKELPNL